MHMYSVNMYLKIYMHTQMYIHMRIYSSDVFTYTYIHSYIRTYIHTCTYMYIYNTTVYIYIYIETLSQPSRVSVLDFVRIRVPCRWRFELQSTQCPREGPKTDHDFQARQISGGSGQKNATPRLLDVMTLRFLTYSFLPESLEGLGLFTLRLGDKISALGLWL